MSFTTQLDAWVKKTDERIEAVFKQSFQRLVEEAQTPVVKGGNMRVDTGFLRNSGQASISSLPIGPDKNLGTPQPEWDNSEVAVTVNRLKLGQTIFFGWTANYAIHRENKDGFVRLASQNWQTIVNQVTKEVKATIR